MKKLYFAFVFFLLLATTGFGQSKTYFSSGMEMIFSFANIEDQGNKESSTLRWAPVFNLQTMVNADLNQHFGVFSGLAVRNVGYIYDNYRVTESAKSMDASQITYKKKFRSYNLAVPVGIKFGNLDKLFFYGGYEVELPFLYKEKTFDNGDKISKITGWFSDREQLFQHGFLAGVQFPYGLNIKFKYYLSEFHNQNYTDGSGNKPYAGLNSHVFYFSLSTYLFKNFDFEDDYTKDKKL
jgi:hypothetical protein